MNKISWTCLALVVGLLVSPTLATDLVVVRDCVPAIDPGCDPGTGGGDPDPWPTITLYHGAAGSNYSVTPQNPAEEDTRKIIRIGSNYSTTFGSTGPPPIHLSHSPNDPKISVCNDETYDVTVSWRIGSSPTESFTLVSGQVIDIRDPAWDTVIITIPDGEEAAAGNPSLPGGK